MTRDERAAVQRLTDTLRTCPVDPDAQPIAGDIRTLIATVERLEGELTALRADRDTLRGALERVAKLSTGWHLAGNPSTWAYADELDAALTPKAPA